MESVRSASWSWSQMAERYYRKRELYALSWTGFDGTGMDLRRFRVFPASNGGLVALSLDEKKLVKLETGGGAPCEIQIYTAAGMFVNSFQYKRSLGRLLTVGWVDRGLAEAGSSSASAGGSLAGGAAGIADSGSGAAGADGDAASLAALVGGVDTLVLVLDDGQVLLYSIWGELLNEFSLGQEAREAGLHSAHIASAFSDGSGGGSDEYVFGGSAFSSAATSGSDSCLVALTATLQFVYVPSLAVDMPRSRSLATPLDAPPVSWCVVPGSQSRSGDTEVIVSAQSGTLLVVDRDGIEDRLLRRAPAKRLCLAPDGRMLASFGADGTVWVCDTHSEFADRGEFATKSSVPPNDMAWCGSDSVVLYWEQMDGLLLIGPNGNFIKFSHDDAGDDNSRLVLVPEIDGCRVISSHTCDLLQRVPDALQDIFAVGSVAPAAMLFDALENYEAGSARADELIRAIGSASLPEAVETCIEAAGADFELASQRALLRAASFGKAFCDFFDADRFVNMARSLRVLNALRDFEVGMPLTLAQYRALGDRSVIARLANRRHHLLARRICAHLRLRPDSVLVHWACCKVRQSASDQSLCAEIVNKLSDAPGISFAEIASAAYRRGRTELATLLLEHEPRAADQVPLLISMGQEEFALDKAIESGDTDLVYLVLLHVRRTRQVRDLFGILRSRPVALSLFIVYCSAQDRELLSKMYYAAGRVGEAASLHVRDALEADSLPSQLSSLESALNVYRESKDTAFAAKVTEDQIKLLRLQAELETRSTGGSSFVGSSLGDTLYKLLLHAESPSQLDQANALAKEFRVPDKRLYWIKVQAFAAGGRWEELERLAKAKSKPPIGFEPFAQACIDNKAPQQAVPFIRSVEDVHRRFALFVQVKAFRDAAHLARELKSLELLAQLRELAPNELESELLLIENELQGLNK